MTRSDFQVVRYRGDAAKAAVLERGVEMLEADDIGKAVAWIVGAPARVSIQDISISPTVQRSPTCIDRRV